VENGVYSPILHPYRPIHQILHHGNVFWNDVVYSFSWVGRIDGLLRTTRLPVLNGMVRKYDYSSMMEDHFWIMT